MGTLLLALALLLSGCAAPAHRMWPPANVDSPNSGWLEPAKLKQT